MLLLFSLFVLAAEEAQCALASVLVLGDARLRSARPRSSSGFAPKPKPKPRARPRPEPEATPGSKFASVAATVATGGVLVYPALASAAAGSPVIEAKATEDADEGSGGLRLWTHVDVDVDAGLPLPNPLVRTWSWSWT